MFIIARTSVSTIKANYQHLTGADKKIASFILGNPAAASEMTIQDLAENVKVSTATVSRFVKRIGWRSFREFSLGFGGIAAQTDSFFNRKKQKRKKYSAEYGGIFFISFFQSAKKASTALCVI